MNPITIVIPFKNTERDPRKTEFNKCLSSARAIVECLFGVGKTLWRETLSKALELKIKRIIKVGFCVAILTNIYILEENFNIIVDEDQEDADYEDNGNAQELRSTNEGLRFRYDLFLDFCQEKGFPAPDIVNLN